MNKKILTTIFSILAGLILGLFLIIIKTILSFVFPSYSKMINHGILILLLLLCSIWILVVFFILVIKVIGEMRFVSIYFDDLHAYGVFSDKVMKELNKRKKKYKKHKYHTLNIQTSVFLSMERLFHGDYENAMKFLEEFDTDEMYKTLKIESGKAKQNDIINFLNFIDLKLSFCYISEDLETAEFLKPYLKTVEDLYSEKYEILRPAISESKLNIYSLTKNSELLSYELDNILKYKKINEIVEVIYYFGLLRKDLINGELTEVSLNNILKECREKAENHYNKVYSLQVIDEYEREIRSKMK